MNRFLKMAVVLATLLLGTMPVFGAEVVDVNRATAETMIQNWNGIGEVKAKAIVAYRKKNGPFKSIDELAQVKGIGDGLIKKNRKYMSLKGGLASPSKKNSSAKSSASSSKSKPSKSKDSSKSKSSGAKKSSDGTSGKKRKAAKKKKTDKKKADRKKPTT